jgi:hypothetical protein
MSTKQLPPLKPELTPTVACLENLRPGLCKWPIGHPNRPGFGFCGRPSGFATYCAYHQGKAYRAVVIVQRGQLIKDSWV